MTKSATTTGQTQNGLTFAGILLVVLGGFNIIDGFVLLQKHEWIRDQFLISNANTWGWILLGIAAVQLVAGISLLRGTGGWGLAVTIAGIGMLLWFMLMFVIPVPALIGCLVNFSIIAAVLSSERR